jgi:hypothetical protein
VGTFTDSADDVVARKQDDRHVGAILADYLACPTPEALTAATRAVREYGIAWDAHPRACGFVWRIDPLDGLQRYRVSGKELAR